MRRASFAQAAMGEGAAALNRVFAAYPVPLTFSSEQLHLHITYNDVDAYASPLWLDDEGEVLAAALLAVRGRRAWLGGFGVAPQYRSKGYAKQLLHMLCESARARNAKTLQLEVLAANLPAVTLYQNAGFETVRLLRSFECDASSLQKPRGFVAGPPSDFLNQPDAARPCWQRERATLVNGAVSAAMSNGRGPYALFRSSAGIAQILKVRAGDPQELNDLAAAIGATRNVERVMILNEPEESAIAIHAQAARWSEPFTQYEMILRLS